MAECVFGMRPIRAGASGDSAAPFLHIFILSRRRQPETRRFIPERSPILLTTENYAPRLTTSPNVLGLRATPPTGRLHGLNVRVTKDPSPACGLRSCFPFQHPRTALGTSSAERAPFCNRFAQQAAPA